MDTTLQDPSHGSNHDDPMLGQVLDGRYRVEARIAVGGMATVYRAVDTRLDRVLAVKVMHPSLAGDESFVERFIREAKSAARLGHTNVVGVYDQGTDGQYVYLAMEYVSGCTLRDVLRDRGALQPRAALDILEPVLAALGAAHRAGLVHRDVKPENVLIGEDGRVKVADFGLVRAVDTQTSATTDTVLGTVSYLAPEQIEDGTADPRADLYACGVMFHEMLTGAKPHTGGTPAQVLYRHLNEPIPAPSESFPGLAPELDALTARATARDPDLRPDDAVALLSETRAARAALTEEQLDAVPPAATSEGAGPASEASTSVIPRPAEPAEGAVDRTTRLSAPPPEPAPRSRRGRSLWVLVTLGVLLVLLVGTGIWYINSGQFTKTPAVLDRPQAEAVRTLQDAGLGVEVEREYSERTDRGHVVSTDPSPGDRVRRNGTVTLSVSRGPQIVKVPDLSGTPLANAQRKLKDAGLTPGTVKRKFDEEAARGSVVSTDPKPGAERRPGAAVALTVSKGAPIQVPDVVGDDESDARDELREAGFEVRTASKRVFSEEDEGDVARQSPGEGRTAAEGQTVTLTLSKGQEMVEVPDVGGMDEDEAREELENAGFEVKVRRLFIGDSVFNQSPDGGEESARGSTVTLWLR